MKIKMKYRSHGYDKNRPKSRHEHKYSKEKSVSGWWCLHDLSNT